MAQPPRTAPSALPAQTASLPPSSAHAPRRRASSGLGAVALLLCSALAAGCASVEFTRETETSGRFESTGIAFTLFAYDFPKRSIDIARENASDSRQPNMQVEEEWTFPSLGPVDWILDLIGIRYSKVSGSWGFKPESAAARR